MYFHNRNPLEVYCPYTFLKQINKWFVSWEDNNYNKNPDGFLFFLGIKFQVKISSYFIYGRRAIIYYRELRDPRKFKFMLNAINIQTYLHQLFDYEIFIRILITIFFGKIVYKNQCLLLETTI